MTHDERRRGPGDRSEGPGDPAEALLLGLRDRLRHARERVTSRAKTHLFDLVHGALFVATGKPEHEGRYEHGRWHNWTDSEQVEPAHFLTPDSEEALSRAVVGAKKLRVVGGGHSFNASPLCRDTMLSLDGHAKILELDPKEKRARVQAGVRLRDLNRALWAAGLGLPVLGSTDAQSIGGLIATDLHGTGRDHGFLSEQVLSLRVVGADGEARTVHPGDPLFHAAFGAIGTCGVVIEAELSLVDAFRLEKKTEMVDRAEAEAGIEALLEENEHVSFYYVGGAREVEAIRMHRWNRTEAPLPSEWEEEEARVELTDFALSAYLPEVARGLVDLDEDHWLSDLLAPDRSLVMPGSRGFGRRLFYRHDEIEFGVPFEGYQACLAEILELLRKEELFSIVEVRFTPDLSRSWIGPGAGRRTAYIELATPLSLDRERAYAKAEAILRRHGGAPHLGKKTRVTAADMRAIHGERWARFQAVRAQQDPGGKFLNRFCAPIFSEE